MCNWSAAVTGNSGLDVFIGSVTWTWSKTEIELGNKAETNTSEMNQTDLMKRNRGFIHEGESNPSGGDSEAGEASTQEAAEATTQIQSLLSFHQSRSLWELWSFSFI